MAAKLDRLFQTPLAFPVFDGPCNGDYHEDMRAKPAAKKRVFVQTDSGSVLDLELGRNDNVHTIKRRLQLALNVPTDESSLTFGDLTLNNDLSAIRNDSPLLLSRKSIHRSSSTPCLSPGVENLQERDQSGPIEILGCSNHFDRTSELVQDIVEAINNGVDPIPVNGGLGGAYYFRNSRGENVAIVKPTDEEPLAPNNPKGFVGKALGRPGLKRSVRVGETGYREVAAYLLDYDHFANVPPTLLVKVTHSVFNVNNGVNGNKLRNREKVSKIASLQQFIPHDFDASDHGTSSFLVAEIHRIGMLDIRIFNTDRHAGNLLVRKLGGIGGFSKVELIPIDHGLCLPESLEDPYFEWIHWPQASVPFSEDELEYIKNLDPIHDSEMLRKELPMIREACLRVLILCTIFLKEAAAFGLCLAEIGEMMSREFHHQEEEPSELEFICLEAKDLVSEGELSFFGGDGGHADEIQFDIDCEAGEVDLVLKMSEDMSDKVFGSESANGQILLPKVEENFEESEVKTDKAQAGAGRVGLRPKQEWSQIASRLSLSLQKVNLDGRSYQFNGGKSKDYYRITRSANEQLPTSTSYVNLADMNEEEWALFIEKFKELLYPAFAKQRAQTIRQRQRLGTSCRF
ncbi:hypothetical protein SLE2022_365160 [Rubroshorea leprosula]